VLVSGNHSPQVGDKIGYKTKKEYLQETVTSMQLGHEQITEAKAGDRIGIKTIFSKEELPVGSFVYCPSPPSLRQKTLFAEESFHE
jgi:hypothetical protein